MHICIITYEFYPIENGITISVERIARNLSNAGHEVHVVCFSGNNKTSSYNDRTKLISEKKEYYVHRITPFSGNVQYPSPQEFQEIVFYIEQLHKKFNFDILHGFRLVPGGFAAVITGKKLGLTTVVSIRGNDVGRNIYDTNLFAMNKYVLEEADRLTFVASDLLEQAEMITPIKNKSVVIHNSFDVKKYMALKEEPKLNLKGKVIGTSGIIRNKKGFSYLLEAFVKYQKTNEATLLLIGDFHPSEHKSYTKMIGNSSLGGSFIKTGVIEHKYVLNYMRLLDIFVLPSLSEGCSNAMLEAMYLKIPIIATNVGAARDILKKDQLIETRNSEEILKVLNSDIETEEEHDYLTKRLKPSNEIKHFMEVYEKC